jgi:hypothetical protein
MYVAEKHCEKCEITHEIRELNCTRFNNVYLYEVWIDMNNPHGSDAWITITAPNNEGYFIDSSVLIPAGPSTQHFYFYPLNAFIGGTVTALVNGNFNDKDCYMDLDINFPPLCNEHRGNKPQADDELAAALLLVAPNPASNFTTIIYSYGKNEGSKTLEVTDLLGRTLLVLQPAESKGSIALDCSHYAEGQYYISMKENARIIKSSKLIIR